MNESALVEYKPKVQEVIELVANGLPLKTALEKAGLSSYRFTECLAADPAQDHIYARARAARAEVLASEVVDIADTEQDPQRARNRMDARKWYASKVLPKQYGDRIDVNVEGTIDLRAVMEKANARILRPVCDQQSIEDAQVIDSTAQRIDGSTDTKSVVPLPTLNDLM